MKRYLTAISVAVLTLTACGRGPQGVPGVTVQVPAPEAAPSDVESIVRAENDYRLYIGQTALTQGLSCNVRQVASGQWLSSSSPGYNAGQGVLTLTGTQYNFLSASAFNQPSASGGSDNSVLPQALRAIFASVNYRLSCTGYLVVTETGYHQFRLSSDDGSILTVAGSQVINNDGNHGMTSKVGTMMLRRGVHSFSLQYAQSGGGNFGLMLEANSELVPGTVFYH